MKRAVIALNVLLPALAPGSGDAYSQARGASRHEIQREVQPVISRRELQELAAQQARERAEQERIALLDPAVRAERFAQLDAILRRLPGRFRIDGRIESRSPLRTLTGKITGIADCSAVGEGVGLNCIINASWPIIEGIMQPGRAAGLGPPPPSEALGTMRPAVLVVGLNIDPPGIRAMMVTADTLTFNWVGTLEGHSANLTRPDSCPGTDVRCYRAFELIAEPDSPIVSFVLKTRGSYTINLTMHPDPEATAEKPVKPMRAR